MHRGRHFKSTYPIKRIAQAWNKGKDLLIAFNENKKRKFLDSLFLAVLCDLIINWRVYILF